MFGEITNPFQELGSPWGAVTSGSTGLVGFLNILIKTLMLVAGLFAVLNVIIAGYSFMTGAGDPKAISNAWKKISWTAVGLFFVAASLGLAALLGWLIFGDPSIIINPKIYGPDSGPVQGPPGPPWPTGQ
jgi:hypothetical protein